ncbi:Dehydrogenase (flavoprotein) [Tenacibaculum sp. MAR_2009_124]|uniref:NAD(P)/FAD-dependent oxidoreductase n=1 Tax=Tenacibaculum sp. MAR_2009_124 TaxID=1250059 RepID=UPI0008983A66|nr:FAD-dependent monooxygenase [Tenacibaculum sp. MAR_2009_124]SEC52035.1 Dehydrogenase (flavoprotein) [Tenacibaculum sp. MAR_2009_124]
MQNSYQVIIVGAGPAGLASSLTLSTYNIPHCIVDANTNSVLKLGDSLPPNAKPLLKQLGILHLLISPEHIPYYGNKSIWGTNEVHQKEFIEGVYGSGFLLDRLHFENQLRGLVKKNRTDFYQGYQLKKVYNHEQFVEALIQKDTESLHLKAKFIIDATGRKASVCRHLGVLKHNLDTQFTVSFWHQTAKKIPRQIWIEATENGWWYLSPKATNEVNCMFFTLKDLLPSRKEMFTFLTKELQKTQDIKTIIQPTDIEFNDYKIMASGTSCLEKPFGENWLAVGDAAFSYDPISSYGITSALASGFYGGHAIAARLKDEEDAFITYRYIIENGAKSYLNKLEHQYNMEQRWPKSFYWKNRLKQVSLV